jgi:hypothetical protein
MPILPTETQGETRQDGKRIQTATQDTEVKNESKTGMQYHCGGTRRGTFRKVPGKTEDRIHWQKSGRVQSCGILLPVIVIFRDRGSFEFGHDWSRRDSHALPYEPDSDRSRTHIVYIPKLRAQTPFLRERLHASTGGLRIIII